jgi:hypothetical protein
MIRVEAFVGEGLLFDYSTFSRKLGQVMKNQISREAKTRMEKVVEDWKKKPSFATDFRRDGNEWIVWVYPVGPVAKVWHWLSGGVKPRVIRPRKKTYLKFKTGYRPKTAPGNPYYSGPGKYTGNTRFDTLVNWPGIEPRNFEAGILKDYTPTYLRSITKGVGNALFGSRE